MRARNIVLIEDNPADVMLVRLALKEQGLDFSLTEFECGCDAVEALSGALLEVTPDAILLDLNTPRTDGFEALSRLKQVPCLSRVPIAILSSSRARSDKDQAAMQGVRYIEKQSHLDDFLTSVGQAVMEMLKVA
jgi:CheY-like chemotaxis protein